MVIVALKRCNSKPENNKQKDETFTYSNSADHSHADIMQP
jgi:hypothetical protein